MTSTCKCLLPFSSTTLFLTFSPHATQTPSSSFHPHMKKLLSRALKDFSYLLEVFLTLPCLDFIYFCPNLSQSFLHKTVHTDTSITSLEGSDGREVKWRSRFLTRLSGTPKERLHGVSRVLDSQVAIRKPQHGMKGAEGFKWGLKVAEPPALKRPVDRDKECFVSNPREVTTENPVRCFSRHLCEQMTSSTRCLSLVSGDCVKPL